MVVSQGFLAYEVGFQNRLRQSISVYGSMSKQYMDEILVAPSVQTGFVLVLF